MSDFATYSCFYGGNIKPRRVTIRLSQVVALEDDINDTAQGKVYLASGLSFSLERVDFDQLKERLTAQA